MSSIGKRRAPLLCRVSRLAGLPIDMSDADFPRRGRNLINGQGQLFVGKFVRHLGHDLAAKTDKAATSSILIFQSMNFFLFREPDRAYIVER